MISCVYLLPPGFERCLIIFSSSGRPFVFAHVFSSVCIQGGRNKQNKTHHPQQTHLSLYLISKIFTTSLQVSSTPSSSLFSTVWIMESQNPSFDHITDATVKTGEEGSESDVCVPIYSSSEVLGKLQEKWKSVKKIPYPAMYSSIFGGITLDPSLMVIPIDDHMVHRGHGIFDTAMIVNGYLYELDTHLDRFLTSASKAKVASPFPRSTLRTILLKLAAASHCKKGSLRYWLSAGPGDFLLSPAGCPTSAFYAVVIDEDFSQCKEGVKAITSTVPMKAPQFATMKNVNYLPNVLSKMEAEEKGAFASIWVDDDGYIAEGPNVNVAFISKSKELLLPKFDKILSGCTARRLLALAPKLVEQGILSSVGTCDITLERAKGSAEAMYVGSGLPILPIIAWDEQPVGDGKVGALTLALSDLLWEDMIAGPETHRLRIPYM